jgi:hypothetical protein
MFLFPCFFLQDGSGKPFVTVCDTFIKPLASELICSSLMLQESRMKIPIRYVR